jgi:serine protease AprX
MSLSRKMSLTLLVCGMLISALALIAGRTAARPDWQQKVDNQVLDGADEFNPGYLIVLTEQADLSGLDSLADKGSKGSLVYERLTSVALRTQPPIIAILEEEGAEFRPYWISNMIWARGESSLVPLLAKRSDVARIAANPQTRLETVGVPRIERGAANDGSVEWNMALINAPDVWSKGVRGDGAVVGGQDTGYDWQHNALIGQYRGWDGQTANHNYSWHDAIHEDFYPNTAPGNPCGYDLDEPCDDTGHGTHTMGTMVGEDGPDNQIGVAPGAQWIGCRNMEQGFGTPATYAECFEWFVAPYPTGGDPFQDGRPELSPHVINNSWHCPPSEGCTDPEILKDVVENVRAAGIVTVHSAGNSGPSCGSISSPAAIYDAAFSVGATDSVDDIAGFSSRGPVSTGQALLLKPDVSAPGVSVRSSRPNNSYGTSSGTSMAAPHVAGLVALLIDARPDLAGNVDLLEKLIADTAVPLGSDAQCGGDAPGTTPNNVFGSGRIDAFAAYEAAEAQSPTPSPTATAPATSTATATSTPAATPSPDPESTATIPALSVKVFFPVWRGP